MILNVIGITTLFLRMHGEDVKAEKRISSTTWTAITIVKSIYTLLIPASFLIAGVLCAAQAEAKDSCTLYRIDSVKNCSLDGYPVTANGAPIGKVRAAKDQRTQPCQISVCIEQQYTDLFDKNTFAYLTDKALAIYRIWPSPTKLQENDSVKSFTSLIDALTYAAETIPRIVKEAVREVLLKALEAAFGTKVDTVTKPPQQV